MMWNKIPIKIILWSGSCIAIMLTFALVWIHYPSLPEMIPTHFSWNGLPNAYGSKTMLLILPFVSLVIFVLLMVVERIPLSFHNSVIITPENQEWQMKNIKLLIQWMQLELAVLFGVLVRDNISVAQGKLAGLSYLPLLVVLVLLITIGIMIYRSMSFPK